MSNIKPISFYQIKDDYKLDEFWRNYGSRSLFPTHLDYSSKELRQFIGFAIPSVKDGTKRRMKQPNLYMPFAYNADIYSYLYDFDEVQFNNEYSPYSLLLYCLRDHYSAIYDRCHGEAISNNDDFNRAISEFNFLYKKAREGRGEKLDGTMMLEQVIDMSASFLKVMFSCQQEDFIIDNNGIFGNRWNGVKVVINMDRSYQSVASRLKNAKFSDMKWDRFFDRFIEDSDRNSFWLFTLPCLDKPLYNEYYAEGIMPEDIVSLCDWKMNAITKRGSKGMIILPVKEEFISYVMELSFGFKQIGEDYWESHNSHPGVDEEFNRLYFTDNIYQREDGRKYVALTNYWTGSFKEAK